jgi:hypothetical protein
MNTQLINRSAVKKIALQLCEDQQLAWTRVSSDFLERANAALDAWIEQAVANQEPGGKTLR